MASKPKKQAVRLEPTPQELEQQMNELRDFMARERRQELFDLQRLTPSAPRDLEFERYLAGKAPPAPLSFREASQASQPSFGNFPQMKGKRVFNDREASANAPLSALRGLASGTLGLAGDVESLGRLVTPGASDKTFFPSSEDFQRVLPGRDLTASPTGAAAQFAGNLFADAGIYGTAKAGTAAAKLAGKGIKGLGKLTAEQLAKGMEGHGPLATALAPVSNRYMFIGPKAETWNPRKAEKAVEMEAAGKTPQEIWATTGTFRGADGNLRQEISDKSSQFMFEGDIKGKARAAKEAEGATRERIIESKSDYPDLFPKQLTQAQKDLRGEIRASKAERQKPGGLETPAYRGNLAEIAYEHPELYKAYPELADWIIKQGGDMGSFLASMAPGEINIFKRGLTNDPRSSAAHEFQHAVQNLEGWAPGGNTAMAFQDPEAFKILAQLRKEVATPMSFEDYVKKGGYSDDKETLARAREEYKDYVEDVPINAQKFDTDLQRRAAEEYYLRLHGEAESRAAQERIDMTPEQRAAKFPAESYDRPQESLIVKPPHDNTVPERVSISDNPDTMQMDLADQQFQVGGLAKLGKVGKGAKSATRKFMDVDRGTSIIKEPGGNWIGEGTHFPPVEKQLSRLKRGDTATPEQKESLRMQLETAEKLSPDVGDRAVRQLKNEVDVSNRNDAINNWVERNLTNYIKKQMGTIDDPVRKLAEEDILHMQPYGTPASGGMTKRKRVAKGYPAEGVGTSEKAKFWERLADASINPNPASEYKNVPADDETLLKNPWLSKLDDKAKVMTASGLDRELGFDHIVDVLRQDVRDGKIRPEQLNKVSMEQAVRRTYEYDQEMARKMAETQLRATEGMPTYKDYPEKGYKWIELKVPEPKLPEGSEVKYLPEVDMWGIYDKDGSTLSSGATKEEAIKLYKREEREKQLADALKYEGETMGHCVGNYCPDVVSGDKRIFSLRNIKTNEPHTTIEARQNRPDNVTTLSQYVGKNRAAEVYDEYNAAKKSGLNQSFENFVLSKPDISEAYQKVGPTNSIVQIKGKQNLAPKEDYQPFVQDFVKSGKWADVGDIQNTGLQKWNDRYLSREDIDALTPEESDAFSSRNLGGMKAGGAVAAKIDGNDFVLAAQAAGLSTDTDTLNKIVTRVNKGESLQEAARAVAQEGGRSVHISDNPDTMRLELDEKKFALGGIVKAGKAVKAGKGLYSAVDKAALGLKRPMGTGKEFMAEIKSTPGVKATELKGRKLADIEAMPKMTKEKFIKELEARPPIKIEEKVLGEPSQQDIDVMADKLAYEKGRSEAYEFSDRGDDIDAMTEENYRLSLKHDWKELQKQAREALREGKGSAYHQQYTIPGGENYREILLKAPQQMESGFRTPNGAFFTEEDLADPIVRQTAEKVGLTPSTRKVGEEYAGKPEHFGGEPNILASIRVSDRMVPQPPELRYVAVNKKSGFPSQDFATPEELDAYIKTLPPQIQESLVVKQTQISKPPQKVLHVEEIQSDWHQAGRKARTEEIDRLVKSGMSKQEAQAAVPEDYGYSTNMAARRQELGDRYKRGELSLDQYDYLDRELTSVPDAPFKKDWQELALRKVMELAAEGGYEKVALTPGVEQAARYDLSEHIDNVVVSPYRAERGEYTLQAIGKDGQTVIDKNDVQLNELDDYIGKELADKARQQLVDYGKSSLANVDLQVGGEGMKSFYDKMLPDYLNKMGKQYGVQVGEIDVVTKPERRGVNIMTPDEPEIYPAKTQSVHSFDVTPQMRQDITEKGLPLYQQIGVPVGAGAAGAEFMEPPADGMKKGGTVQKTEQTIQQKLADIRSGRERKFQIGGAVKALKGARAIRPSAEANANLAKFLEESALKQRLYHGTRASEAGKGEEAISRLKPSKEGALGSGVYMTPKSDFASSYAESAGGNVLPVYSQMKKPLIIEGKGDPMIEALTKLGMDEDKAVRMVERAYDQKGYIGKEVQTRAQAQGYDGLMQYRDGDLNEVVSYNPNAIKSATGNVGDYDVTQPELSKQAGGVVKALKGVSAAERAAAGRKAAEMIKAQPQIKASEALGQAREKGIQTTATTQADRTRVGGGNIGGGAFSAISEADPLYAGKAWGVMTPGAAKRLKNLTTPETAWTTMLGSATQLKTNPIVFAKLEKQFKEALKAGKLSPELEAKINHNLALTFGEGADIRDPKIWKEADTFDKRAALADLMMGQGIEPSKGGVALGGEKSGKGVIFKPTETLIKETEPTLMPPEFGGDVPTYAAGPRLFTLSGESSFRPDLHPGFPELLTGKDLGVSMKPTPTEVYLPEWHKRFKAANPERKPGYYDLSLGVKGEGLPSQQITDEYIRHLIREGFKEGGAVKKKSKSQRKLDKPRVKISSNPDTMYMELNSKRK